MLRVKVGKYVNIKLMNVYVALIICVAGTLMAQALLKAYFYLPKKELRRRVYTPKPEYRKLYMVSKYGTFARVFIVMVSFVFAATAVIVASRIFSPFVALLSLAVFFSSLRIVSSKNSAFAIWLAAAIAPYLAKLLHYLEPIAKAIKNISPSSHKRHNNSDIYETEDLQDLIKIQQKASNNRIPQKELIAALNALEFGGKQIKDHMIPKAKIHFVTAKDPIGPILLSELHKTGFKYFPVRGNSENEAGGMLYLEDLAKHTEGGLVSQAMDPKVFYIHEDKPLEEVLQAFSKTGRHEFIVLDSQAQITGSITLKEVLEQMTGHSAKTDFDDYEDASAVAGN